MSPRQLWALYEPVHAVTYFAPEAQQAFAEAGLRGFWRGYFAGRTAPLGPVGPAPVTALYAGFAPAMVERALPGVWDLVTPERALAVRLDGAVAALARLTDGLDDQVAEAAPLLRAAAEAAEVGGRALGEANAGLPWPDAPLAVLWQAATVLREVRGDGHVAAQLTAGLSGLETMVLRSGHDLDRTVLQPHRGWTDDDWTAA
ncbi:MAG: hypothetical protein Q7T52_13700, partial [Nocardioides sp.]|nr:hypothetical protein [Nocardioides sp.]